jgi:hypothetical protein
MAGSQFSAYSHKRLDEPVKGNGNNFVGSVRKIRNMSTTSSLTVLPIVTALIQRSFSVNKLLQIGVVPEGSVTFYSYPYPKNTPTLYSMSLKAHT